MSKREKLLPADQYFFDRYGTIDPAKIREIQAAKAPKISRKRIRQGDMPPPKNLAARDLQTVPNSSNILKGDTLWRPDGSSLPRAAIRGMKKREVEK